MGSLLKLNKFMDTNKMKELGEKWKVLNKKYDGYIQEIIDAPESVVLTPERLEVLKSLQIELFELEEKLLDSCQYK